VFDNQGIENQAVPTFATALGDQNSGGGPDFRFGMITGRSSHMSGCGPPNWASIIVRQGVRDKLAVTEQIIAEAK